MRNLSKAIDQTETKDESVIYSPEIKTLLYMLAALILRVGLPVVTHWRCTKGTYKDDSNVRYEMAHGAVDPMMACLLAAPYDANGLPAYVCTHNSIMTISCKSNELRDMIYDSEEVQGVMTSWTKATTNEGLATLRFDHLGLTGKDGSPVLQNSGEFCASIRTLVNKVRLLVTKIANSKEGSDQAYRCGGMPTVDGCDMHIMLHPSDAVYETPDDEIPYVIKAFTTIVEKSGAYREAFADPVYAMDGQRSFVMTTTTKEGAGNIYKVL